MVLDHIPYYFLFLDSIESMYVLGNDLHGLIEVHDSWIVLCVPSIRFLLVSSFLIWFLLFLPGVLDLFPRSAFTLLLVVAGETREGSLLFFFFFLTENQGASLTSLQLSKRASNQERCLGVVVENLSRILFIVLGETPLLGL